VEGREEPGGADHPEGRPRLTQTQKNKKTNQKRTVTKQVKCKSFFGLFADFTNEEEEDKSYNEEEEEQPNLYLLKDTLEELFDIVPFSLEYYLGTVDMDDEDDEGFEDEDEGEVKDKAKKGGKGAKDDKGAPGKDGAKKEECNKQ
jgi:hypothetical protein